MKMDRKKVKCVVAVLCAVLLLAGGVAAAWAFWPGAARPALQPQTTGQDAAGASATQPDTSDRRASAGTTGSTVDAGFTAVRPTAPETTAPPASSAAPSSGAVSVTPADGELYLTADTPVRASASADAKKLGTATKNTCLTVTGRSANGWTRVVYKNKTGYVPTNKLTKKAPAVQKSSPYLIKVNRTQNLVTVYKKDDSGEYTKPYRAMVCSVGTSGNTPRGTFATTDRYTWRLLEGNVYGQYATRITGHILFHSVPYYTKDKGDLESAEYNKLGSAASLGCVRLSVKDAKWIYDNCPKNTAVVIYDSDAPEPLEKPKPIRLDLKDERCGWDPTDPDPKNPWNAPPAQTSGAQ